jgi:hypothetical protein
MAVMRVHGTTARRPVEMFAELEGRLSATLPEPCDQPVFTRVKVHRDYHGEVARALSSVLSICSARAWTSHTAPLRPLYHHGRKAELSRPRPDGLQRGHHPAPHRSPRHLRPRPLLRVVVNAALRD